MQMLQQLVLLIMHEKYIQVFANARLHTCTIILDHTPL